MVLFGNTSVSLISPIKVEQNQCNVKVPMFVEGTEMAAATGLSEVEAKVWERLQEYWDSSYKAANLTSFYNEYWSVCELGSVKGSTLGGAAVYQVWNHPAL